jgi:TetR/AcrR family transcriptional regulator, transcriptional repressor for nem operon
MSAVQIDSRTKLVRAARRTTYQHGFAQTSLAEIAKESGVPLGNVYYYFKTKDAIGEAMIEDRLTEIRESHESWAESESPRERLCAFVDYVLSIKGKLARSGCSIGTLNSELNKGRGPLAKKASGLLKEHLTWSQKQFELLGKKNDSYNYAVHLLAVIQGLAVLAHSFNDPDIVVAETARLRDWIRGL